jgi:hypothetical protein
VNRIGKFAVMIDRSTGIYDARSPELRERTYHRVREDHATIGYCGVRADDG